MLLIRKVTMEDSEKILKWRNSPEIYKFLFHPFPVERDSHIQWLTKVLNNSNVGFYIIKYHNDDIGTVRFDFEENGFVAEVGIYLAPEFQGQGLGSKMLHAAEIHAKKEFPSLTKIIAKVIPENKASEKMFLKTGYKEQFIQLEKDL